MKKLFLLLCLMGAGLSQMRANDAALFSYDRNAMETAISSVAAIENFVAQNPEISINDLAKTGNLLVNGVDINTNPFGLNGEPPLGISSFLWGCIFGWVGLLVVYIATDNDKEQVKKALWGCVTATATWIIFYFVFWGAVFASAGA
jgi:Na+/proline symporter